VLHQAFVLGCAERVEVIRQLTVLPRLRPAHSKTLTTLKCR
jgi:hypothetical protein